MKIVGTGIDLVEVPRFRQSVKRWGIRFLDRLFTPEELAYCRSYKDPHEHLAVRFAAKEAMAKALGAPVGMHWHDAEVLKEESGRPVFTLRGTVLAQADALGVGSVHLSLSHDAGIASAVVVLES